jgi:hypothetical protein
MIYAYPKNTSVPEGGTLELIIAANAPYIRIDIFSPSHFDHPTGDNRDTHRLRGTRRAQIWVPNPKHVSGGEQGRRRRSGDPSAPGTRPNAIRG